MSKNKWANHIHHRIMVLSQHRARSWLNIVQHNASFHLQEAHFVSFSTLDSYIDSTGLRLAEYWDTTSSLLQENLICKYSISTPRWGSKGRIELQIIYIALAWGIWKTSHSLWSLFVVSGEDGPQPTCVVLLWSFSNPSSLSSLLSSNNLQNKICDFHQNKSRRTKL